MLVRLSDIFNLIELIKIINVKKYISPKVLYPCPNNWLICVTNYICCVQVHITMFFSVLLIKHACILIAERVMIIKKYLDKCHVNYFCKSYFSHVSGELIAEDLSLWTRQTFCM